MTPTEWEDQPEEGKAKTITNIGEPRDPHLVPIVILKWDGSTTKV